jgi:hypothetical protein
MTELSGELVEPLDYDQTLAALQALVGIRVSVVVADADTRRIGASFDGPLRSSVVRDAADQVPELEDDFPGEEIIFVVADPDQTTVTGSFSIWREGFEWGRYVPPLETVSFRVAGLSIHVRTESSL